MFRKNNTYETEIRHEMRGGSGDVKIEHFWKNGADLQAPTRLFARLTLKPGSSIGFHRHEDEEEVFVILQGCARMDDDGTEVLLGVGDTILTGNGAGHAVCNVGDTDLVMMAVISPY